MSDRVLVPAHRMCPLEFDGTTGGLHHPFDAPGWWYPEFLRWHGGYDDVDHDLLVGVMRCWDPGVFREGTPVPAGSPVEQVSGR